MINFGAYPAVPKMRQLSDEDRKRRGTSCAPIKAGERALIEADRSRRRRAEVIDKVAAAYILQGALDRLGRDG